MANPEISRPISLTIKDFLEHKDEFFDGIDSSSRITQRTSAVSRNLAQQ
ncbi:MAG: hypothetical protein LKF41_04300 [Bifidobacterium sp.]|nr:hypothetical protein [Bifidobacterium sp.]MCH4175066.1 hypothetical protein [Bifidobacterium sp.]